MTNAIPDALGPLPRLDPANPELSTEQPKNKWGWMSTATSRAHTSWIRSLFVLLLILIAVRATLSLLWGDSELDADVYIPLSVAMGMFSVAVSMLVFAVAWNARGPLGTQSLLILACGFLAVALLDVAYTLSMPGMPAFFTPSSAAKGVNFFLLARLLAALALLYYAFAADRSIRSAVQRYALIGIALALVALIYWVGLWHAELFPAMFGPGGRPTPFKVGAEYALIAINTVVALACYRRHRVAPSPIWALLGLANVVMALSELFLALYASSHEVDDFLGHAYKILAYYLIYRALFTLTIREPYARIEHLKVDVTRTEERLREEEARGRGIIASAMDAIISVDAAQNICVFNPAAERMFGYAGAEMIGQPLARLIPSRFQVAHRHHVEQFGETGLTERAMGGGRTLYGRRVDGTEFQIEASVSRLDINGTKRYTAIIRDISDRVRAEASLAASNEALRALAMRAESTRNEERRRIARELHDQMGSVLAALRMDTNELRNHADTPPPIGARLADMEGLMDEAAKAMRAAINDLHPPALDLGLVPALEWQADQFSQHAGIPCTLSCANEGVPVESDRALAIYRLVQEALTNVAKHAVASAVEINLKQDDGEITVEVYDNGRGIAPADTNKKGHFGLIGMRERVKHFGGQIAIIPRSSGGTVVTITVPFGEAGASERPMQ